MTNIHSEYLLNKLNTDTDDFIKSLIGNFDFYVIMLWF